MSFLFSISFDVLLFLFHKVEQAEYENESIDWSYVTFKGRYKKRTFLVYILEVLSCFFVEKDFGYDILSDKTYFVRSMI